MRTFSIALTAAAAVLVLPSISHASNYAGTWTWNIHGKATKLIKLQPQNTHFCYLSKVGVGEKDGVTNYSRCRVYRAGVNWYLETISNTSGTGSKAECSATCYTN